MKFFAAFVVLFAVAAAGNPLYTWSLQDLNEAVGNPNTNPALRPALEYALGQLMNLINNGYHVDSIVVPTPVNVGIETAPTTWTLQELSEALQNPYIEPSIVPYLEDALDELMTSIFSGNSVNSVVVYLPVDTPLYVPTPIVPEPAIPEDIPESSPPLPAAGPLVQIIVNVNNKQQQFTEIGAQDIVPTPVHVVDHYIPAHIAALLRPTKH